MQSRVNQGLRNITSIAFGYKWSVCFLNIIRNKTKISDHVVITTVKSVHSNSCDPSYICQFVLTRTRSGDYKCCCDEILRTIMVQMTIDPFVNVRVMIELLQKALPGRKDVDIHMINNVRLCVRRKKLELDSKNIQIDSKYFY